MGAAASTSDPAVIALRQELSNAQHAVIDTPRGVTAKEEVVRLRALLASHAPTILEPKQNNQRGDEQAVDEQEKQQQAKSPLRNVIPTTNETATHEEASEEAREAVNESDGSTDDRVACVHCSRKFRKQRVAKHETVCLAKGSTKDTLAVTEPVVQSKQGPAEKSKQAVWREKRKALKDKLRQDRLKQRQAAAASRPIAQQPEAAE